MNPDTQFQPPQQDPVQGTPANPNLPPAGAQFQPQAGFPPQPQPQFQPPQPAATPPAAPPPAAPELEHLTKQSRKRVPWLLVVPLIIFVLGFFASSGFAFWAYAQMNDYKNNVDEKVAIAVADAVKATEEVKEKEFLERSKSPYKTYRSPGTYGNIEITYPKSWAATVNEHGSSTPVGGYFHPDFVPGPDSETAFALRLEVIEQPYNKILGRYEADAKRGRVKVLPFKLKRVPAVLGARVNGEVVRGYQGSAVLFPLRDKTIRVSTLSYKTFGADFEKIILEKLIFTP